MTTVDKVKETAKEELTNLSNEAQNAAKSGGYLYPFRVSNHRHETR